MRMYLVIGKPPFIPITYFAGTKIRFGDVGTLAPGSLLLRGCGDPLLRRPCPSSERTGAFVAPNNQRSNINNFRRHFAVMSTEALVFSQSIRRVQPLPDLS